jgi:hypothetical protein
MALDINALARYGAQARLAELVAEMDAILEAFPDLGKSPARGSAPAQGRTISEATKEKMRAAWARRKAAAAGDQPVNSEAIPKKKKRTMSAAGKAAIAAAQKRRWAKIKARKKR